MQAKNSEVDIVIVAACGERAGEVVEVLKEFPELEDPKTGRSLMERTIIICNTSSMPVAAREASCYTAVTLAEYYRQMGLDVLLLADSTSRWAQAMREMSGRLEEIPGEEAFPAYLESTIAAFYERAGKVRLGDDTIASITIGGTVSPAGGNFEEPVTQATLKVVGAFHGLARERSDARKYPAIHPTDSWSKYTGVVDMDRMEEARGILIRSNEVNQMMKVVGEEGTSNDDYIIYQKGELLDSVYLQQNSFDPIDAACVPERQEREFARLYDAMMQTYDIQDKRDIRAFFNQLRQEFLDWHGTEFESKEFEAQEKKISDFYMSKVVS
jgi:V/A-type H+-transporting ATPase subunit A